MLEQIYNFINYHTVFLYRVIYENAWFFIDFWSVNHLVSGFFIMSFALRKKYSKPFGILLVSLFAWEATEMAFIYFAVGIFRPEILPDQVTDIVVGLTGGSIALYYLRYMRKKYSSRQFKSNKLSFIDISIACIVSFYWVGYYGYKYNIPYLNSQVINWLALILWSAGLICNMMIYKYIRQAIGSKWLSLGLTWLTYLALLLLVEFIGYDVLGIRQITEEKPLIFGLIHGTKTLKIYYLLAGMGTLALSKLVKKALAPVELYSNETEEQTPLTDRA